MMTILKNISRNLMIVFFLLAFSGVNTSIAGIQKIDLPNNVKINVHLKVESNGKGSITLTNQSENLLLNVAHPIGNHGSLAFFISDQYGNLIKPTFTAKVNTGFIPINLPVQKSANFRFSSLKFVTGTGQVEYQLVKGNKYRILAIYRPAGLQNMGFTSNEISIVYNGA